MFYSLTSADLRDLSCALLFLNSNQHTDLNGRLLAQAIEAGILSFELKYWEKGT